MKKTISAILIVAALLGVLSLASCGIIGKLEGTVTYPDVYSITYRITTAEGSIYDITRSVDKRGNVYFKTMDAEQLFMNDNGTYTLYEKGEDGNFTVADSVKYTRAAVDNATSAITEYTELSKNKFIPTAKKDADGTILGRACEVYKLGVGTDSTGSYHYYYVDKETGICLGMEVKQAALGEQLEHRGDVFTCTEFTTDDIPDLSGKLG